MLHEQMAVVSAMADDGEAGQAAHPRLGRLSESIVFDEDGDGGGEQNYMDDGHVLEREPPAADRTLGQLSQLSLSAIESREVDAEKVKLLLSIKALSQDQVLAGHRRQASSSYLGTGRRAGERESRDIVGLRRKLNERGWTKSATTGNAEPLLRARRDVELCDAVQSDMALCAPSAQAPALLWCSMPAKNARRLGSLDMISQVLPQSNNHFHEIPVAQDLETLKRVVFLEKGVADDAAQVESYAGPEGEPGMPIGLAHTISRKTVGDIHAQIQASPFLSAAINIPLDSEAMRRSRAMWAPASGIGSLGPAFGTSRSLFELRDRGIQEAEMCPENAYDVASLSKCTDFRSIDEIGASGHHPAGQTTDGLRTVSPERFGIRTFASHAEYSTESPADVRSPQRAGRPMGFDMMIQVTHPQQRSPRQHRRALNLERGPETHDEKHRMARSIASFRDIVPSTILDVTSNYQEFYPEAKQMTSEASRASALPFVVNNNSLFALKHSNLPAVYYAGDGVLKHEDGLAKSKAAVEANEAKPTLPFLTSFVTPVFSVNGAAIPSTAVAVRQMPSTQQPCYAASERSSLPTSARQETLRTRPGTGITLTRPNTQEQLQLRPFTPASTWFTLPTTPNDPTETAIVFINKIGEVDQELVDSFYPHFEEFTLGRRVGGREGSPSSRLSTPRTSTFTPISELSLPSASSATRHLKSSDTVRDIRTADVKEWTVPRTPRKQELGLKWEKISSRKLGEDVKPKGTVLNNVKLSAALKTKLEFTKAEFERFSVSGITPDSYVEVHTIGLKWMYVGSKKPESGTQISNEALAAALQTNMEKLFNNQELTNIEFNRHELESFNFNVPNLSYDSYIQVDSKYFKPVEDRRGIEFYRPADLDPQRAPDRRISLEKPQNSITMKFSPPRTPQRQNAEPPSRAKKVDALRDLLEAREGFKAKKEAITSVEVVINDGGHGYWDAQTLWAVGGLLICESEPYDQKVETWRAAKRGMEGHYAEDLIYQSKLTRICHVDEIILLQERSLQDRAFALDIVSAEMHATFKSKFVWKKGLTGIRAERGDLLRVYRAKKDDKVYAEYQGYPGIVPASAIEVSNKVTKRSVTFGFKSLEHMHQCLKVLQDLSPKAGLRLEPRTALLNAFGREGISNKKSRQERSALQDAFAHAHNRMASLQALVQQEHDMLQDQMDKSVLIGMPRRHVKANDLKNLPAATIFSPPVNAEQFNTLSSEASTAARNADLASPRGARPTSKPVNGSPSALKPPTPKTPTSPLSRRTNAAPTQGADKGKKKTTKLVKFGVCAVCETRGQCMVNVPKYCNRCALKSVNENLNKGDLREAAVACNHLVQLVSRNETVREITVGENSALQTRCDDARARVQEATRLSNIRDLFRAAHCGDVTKIAELAVSDLDVTTSVGALEWVPSQGFLTTRAVLRGFTAVHYACMAFTGLEVDGKKEALVKLVEGLGLDPHVPAEDGRLPMHIAVNELPCLNYLIYKQQGNVEWRDGDDRTVLHHAALYGGLEARIFLIGVCEADHTVQDRFNKTPVDYNPDVAVLVRKKRSLKMICAFFKKVIVMKCFYVMKKHKKDPPYMLKFVPTDERKQNIVLAARVTRRILYKDWHDHGHPRLLKPWSSLLHEKSGISLESELSRLSSLDWTNALEWSWYIAHESPSCLSPVDGPVWEIWCGGPSDFDQDPALVTQEADEELNMTMAEQGKSLTVSTFVVHYDARVVYKLESRPPTAEYDLQNRVRTPKDKRLRTRKPNISLLSDGVKDVGVKDDQSDISRTGSMWSRVGSFTRALSFTRVLSGTSQAPSTESKGVAAQSNMSAAASLSRVFSFSKAPTTTQSTDAGNEGGGDNVSLGAKAIAATFSRSFSLSKRTKGTGDVPQAACESVPSGRLGSTGLDSPILPAPPPEERTMLSVLRTSASFKRAIIPPSAVD